MKKAAVFIILLLSLCAAIYYIFSSANTLPKGWATFIGITSY